MQPLQYVSQYPVANLHLSTHVATPDDNNQAAIPMRSATTDSRNASTHIDTTTRCRTQRRNPSRPERPQPHPPHTRGTFHRRLQPLYTEKLQGLLRVPPQDKAQATFMQPLQYVSQYPVANLHLSTHMATPDDNNHAAIPMRSATTDSRNYAHRHNHPLQNRGGTHSRQKRPQPHPPHTRGTFHRRLQPLYTGKKQGFVLLLPPQNTAQATVMQP